MPSRDDLDNAYRATHYHVFAEAPFILTIDQYSHALADLYARHGIDHCAYLTACNPYSRLLEAADNARRQAALGRASQRRGIILIDGSSRDPSGQWPAEAGILALGLGRHAACRLAARFGQNAIVYCGPSAIPELVWLDPDPSSPSRTALLF
ncbi:MAG: DUF3293 domain-containing protein [Alcaligenaceae bacterium]|nr:DUF3293 domain-containing protein [Alcaligenaceae bacterium]